jgi:DNA-binding SARP family transcriptional activator
VPSNRVADPAAPPLTIRLLGGFELRRDGELLPPMDSARAGSLLAYLVLRRGKPQARQQLAFLLWPDSTESQARTNLRHVLHHLRRGLPEVDRYVEVTQRTLTWRADAPYRLDVDVFERLLNRAAHAPPEAQPVMLREAVDSYPGDLLEGGYDEWLLGERDRLRRRYQDAVARLAELSEAHGEPAAAIGYAEQLLRGDPLREEAYRLLMRMYHAQREPARALRAYHVCASTLERELGVAPSAETRRLYESLLPSTATFESARVGPPLVGRGTERRRLTDAWRAVESGGAGFVLVTGEAGIGKTRLVEEFGRWCAHRGAVVAEARCYPAEGILAYAPIVAWLRSEPMRRQLPHLERPWLTELARLLPELPVELPGLPRPEPLPEADQRQRLFDAVGAAIQVAGGPLLLVVDDVQWCDHQTLRFLHYLLRVRPRAPLLVVATGRWEEAQEPLYDLVNGLRLREGLTEIELGRLSPAETATLAGHLAGSAAVDSQRLYRETEGNPLFVIEALRAGSSSPKVQAVIEARLSRLSESARELVGLAATIGREFTTEVLGRAGDADQATLIRDLDELWRRRIVRERGPDGYDFSHDKLRQVAYQGLSPARRRRHHLRIAEALRAARDVDSAQIARHFERAGASDEAVGWYAEAARTAQLLHANPEAVGLLDRAVELLGSRHESRDRNLRELALRNALLAPLGAIEGYASPRLSAVQQRALQLVRAVGGEPAPPLLRSLAIGGLIETDYQRTQRYGEQLLARGERDGDDMLVVEAGYVLGIAAFWQARFDDARRRFELAVARYRPEQRQLHLLRYGQDPEVVCLSRMANTLWFLGQAEAAVAARDTALAHADEVGHPFSRAVTLVFAALLALDMNDTAGLRLHVAKLAAVGAPGRANQIVAGALRGLLDVLDGRDGVPRIKSAIAETSDGDAAPGMSAALQRILLAAYLAIGDAESALATADRLLEMGGGAAVWEAEARRVREAFLATTG